MLTLGGLFIFALSFSALRALDRKYMRDDEDSLEVDDFISRASLEDIIKARHHVIDMWVGLGIMSIGSVLR